MPRHPFLAAVLTSLVALSACSPSGDLPGMAVPVLEDPMVMVEPAIAAESAPAASLRGIARSPGGAPAPRHGVITAADIDDTLNLAAFRRYQSRAAKTLKLPRTNLNGAFVAQLTGPDGRPATGVPFTLRRPGSETPFFQGYSGVDGHITVFPAALGLGTPRRAELRVVGEGQQQAVQLGQLTAGAPSKRVQLPFEGRWRPDFVDLVLVIDTTGSMGDEIAWLKKEFAGLVRTARRAAPGADFRFGLIAYRDMGDDYIVRNYGMSKQLILMQGWLRNLDANGGGDYPEAADKALGAAAGLNWRRGKGERILIHVADAPAHDQRARAYLAAAQDLARRDVQIFGLAASGTGPEAEFLMRQAAVQSQGRYLFLTDDSGVGNAHAEPTIACYRVTRLRDLLTRVLKSELTGHRVEAGAGAVIRDVGSYRAGRCIQ